MGLFYRKSQLLQNNQFQALKQLEEKESTSSLSEEELSDDDNNAIQEDDDESRSSRSSDDDDGQARVKAKGAAKKLSVDADVQLSEPGSAEVASDQRASQPQPSTASVVVEPVTEDVAAPVLEVQPGNSSSSDADDNDLNLNEIPGAEGC